MLGKRGRYQGEAKMTLKSGQAGLDCECGSLHGWDPRRRFTPVDEVHVRTRTDLLQDLYR